MTQDDNTESEKPTIIDLDPDQVVETPEKANTETATLPRTTSQRFLLWSAAALAAAAIGGGWLYRDVVSRYFPSDELRAAQSSVMRLEADNKALHEEVARVSKLADTLGESFNTLESKVTSGAENANKATDQALAAAKDNEAKLAALDAALKDTKKAIAAMSAGAASSSDGTAGSIDGNALVALTARVESLEKDVASLKSSGGTASADVTVLSQSLSDLKAKIAAGTGFAPELERIQRLVPAAPGLDVLAQHAEAGLPDAKGLAAELTGLADSLPKPATEPAGDEGSLLSNAWKALSSVVRIHNIGEADWPAAARAAASLADQGDLRQAIGQLNSIEGAKPAGLAQWMERAEARLKLEAAEVDVSAAVMRMIAAKG